MGMGYFANFAVTIEDEAIIKVAGKRLFDKFTKALDAVNSDDEINEFNICKEMVQDDEITDEQTKLVDAYNKAIGDIQDKFMQKFGIKVYREYHNCDDDGDRYDDVSGGYWHFDFHKAYQPSKELKAFRKAVGTKLSDTISHYVNFG